MKIIKRDGRIVEYKREKIEKAILNANRDVIETDRVNKKQIDTIIKHIEELNKNAEKIKINLKSDDDISYNDVHKERELIWNIYIE